MYSRYIFYARFVKAMRGGKAGGVNTLTEAIRKHLIEERVAMERQSAVLQAIHGSYEE